MTRVAVEAAGQSPAGATNAYLLGRDRAILIDPPARAPALDDAVDSASVAHVAVTHTHPDHVGAVAEYAARTGATVWARRTHADRFERATGRAPDRLFREGTIISADEPVEIVETPGHAPDHVAFVHDGTCLSGDLVFADLSAAVGADDGDLRAYLTSLRRLLVRDLDRLLPGHGAPVESPARRLRQTLAHRRHREQRVLSAVEAGAESVDAVVDRAYEVDLDADRRALARDVVRAHLAKLVVEGRVSRDRPVAAPT
ncbi:MAG: MBL fold metallo-hydrolase [Halobacteriaceae archaeon]